MNRIMHEYLCNDVVIIMAPVLLLLTLVNVVMILTAYKADNISGEDNGDEGPDKLIYTVLQNVYACQAEHLIAQQQENIQHLSVRVAELCEWLGQLTRMVHSNKHVMERLLSISIQQRRRIEMLRHRLARVEEVLDALVDRERQQEKERKERAKRERAEKRKAGIWEVSGRQLRRIGREEKLRAGRDQEGVEREVESSSERGFVLAEGSSEDFGSLFGQEMENSRVLQRDEDYPVQSESPLPFFERRIRPGSSERGARSESIGFRAARRLS